MGEKTGEYIFEIVKDSDGVYCYIKQGEIVRCKDCKHFEAINNDDHGWCKMISDLPCGISARYDDDYCSLGERADK